MNRKCLECNSTLKGKQEKFCSNNCRQKNWKKNNGKESVNKWQREYFRKKARENWVKKECVVCKKRFLPDFGHKNSAKYCSKKCFSFLCKKVSRQNNRVKKIYNLNESITVQDWLNILNRDGWKCVKCGQKNKIEMDHTVPLSKGGHHVKENIRVSCRKCNRKNDTSFKCKIALQT